MVEDQESLDQGAPDRPCATCGHDSILHALRETELAGNTVRETYCEGCGSPCDYFPAPEEPFTLS